MEHLSKKEKSYYNAYTQMFFKVCSKCQARHHFTILLPFRSFPLRHIQTQR